MRIPNKFNGYSADNRRIYNDPATVVATIGSMSEAATVAETMAALTAATAPVAETALTAATAAELAGQGLMQGLGGAQMASPLAAAPEVAGSSAMTTAGGAPLTTAGGSVPTTAGADLTTTAGGINPAGQNQVIDAFTQAQANPNPAPQYGPQLASNTTITQVDPNVAGPGAQNLMSDAEKIQMLKGGSTDVAPKTGNGLLDGFRQAAEWVGEKAGQAYDAYRQAPMPLQALGALAGYQKFMAPKQEGPAKYKRTPYSGLSPNFVAGGPSPYLYGANGGLMNAYADGGTTGSVEQMSNANAIGDNTMYPMANISPLEYANPVQQRPISQNVIDVGDTSKLDPYTGMPSFASGGSTDDDEDDDKESQKTAKQQQYYSNLMSKPAPTTGVTHHTEGFGIIPRSRVQSVRSAGPAAHDELVAMLKKHGIKSALPKALDPQGSGIEEAASGGIMHGLGGYSDGGRLLKGPGDGVSDSIPAVIGSRQPARLADGEFVIPARIVSELGNGSTEAGARQLYGMMDRIQNGRKKSVGKGKVAIDSKAKKHLPA